MASLKTSDFNYHLPPELIAQEPAEPRDHSRLLVLEKETGKIEHRFFYELPEYLNKGDLIVFNDSRVIHARLLGHKEDTGGKAEIFLLRSLGEGIWEVLSKPARRLKKGNTVIVKNSGSCQIEVEIMEEGEGGIRIVRLHGEEYIEKLGEVPLPPYIHSRLSDPGRYQTVYARAPGSVAAPTAGLHFTTELMQALQEKGIGLEYVTLHVGLDSFRTVSEVDPEDHFINREWAILSEKCADSINRARESGGRIICVGTTVVRSVEQSALSSGLPSGRRSTPLKPFIGWCNLFILPGYSFRLMDVLVTNFHPPLSTQLMLVSAFTGRGKALSAYSEAVKLRYRFLSLGDTMLVF